MPDDPAFLRMIAATPDDDAPRLVYADVLDERGDPASAARAEFIRVQCERARLKPDSPQWRELWHRDTALLDWARQWRAELPTIEGVQYGGYVRGFIDRVRLLAGVNSSNLAALCDVLPLRTVCVEVTTAEDVQRLTGAVELDVVWELEVRNLDQPTTQDAIAALAARGPWPSLRRVRGPWWIIEPPYPGAPDQWADLRGRFRAAFGHRLTT
jgi:uncharacterized protein (TIGR02996 family)